MMTAMPKRTALSISLAAGCGLAMAACSSAPNVPAGQSPAVATSSAHPSVVVGFQFDSFEPSRVTIHAGQTVEWTWGDKPTAIPANVTFAGVASPTQVSGTWFRTFSAPGTYTYRDTLSPVANGSVTVLP
jgi:plastocyanin